MSTHEDFDLFRGISKEPLMSLTYQNVKSLIAPGVYFLLNQDRRVIYVGQSHHMGARLSAHIHGLFQKETEGILFTFIEVPRSRYTSLIMKKLESFYIVVYHPTINIQNWRKSVKKALDEAEKVVEEKPVFAEQKP